MKSSIRANVDARDPSCLTAVGRPPKRRLVWPLLFGLWLASLALGFAVMIDYGARPGTAVSSLPMWPAESKLRPAGDCPTLVMFIHPECSCSWASLEELDSLLSSQPLRTRLYVVVLHTDLDDPEHASRTVKRAVAIPGAVLVSDPDGAESDHFGTHTSGTLLVFDASGRRQFSGGVTLGRGHVGQNKARDAAAAALQGQPTETSMPVFGCPLF